ncbi:MAG: hypothetical protein RL732_1480 [Bacteroidota bacterium]
MKSVLPYTVRILYCVLLNVLLYQPAVQSQQRRFWPTIEAGITAGPSNFLGDLGGNVGRGTTFLKDNNFKTTNLMLGAYFMYHPYEWLGIRLAANKGHLEGDDAIIDPKGGWEENRKFRNSNFRSPLTEALLLAEIYPTVYLNGLPFDLNKKILPYGLIGVGVFHFNPEGQDPLTGQWVPLRDLHTEGQGFPEFPDRKNYKLTEFNIPMGFGFKYIISEKINVSFEVIHRVTFTDYIDDVSTTYVDPLAYYKYLTPEKAQIAERMANKTDPTGLGSTIFGIGNKRGTAQNNDAYYSFGLKWGYVFGNRSSGDSRSKTKCPKRFN